ncbi:AraC family transcriptional regulator [Thauera butanivorans]|uniref:AraC family transcriptional regulator n=1 Tax=Thauera butanivorans TaxID=86174 RepID=UPI0009FD16D4|nr:AraC family transcriptional regulator [Thauera butanivorans]
MLEILIFCSDHPMLPDEPLSQLLALAGVQAAVSTGLQARGLWALRVASLPTLKCNVIRRGECGLEVAGQRWALKTGDCFLVAPGRPFTLGTDLDRLAQPAQDVFAGCENTLIAQLDAGPGPEFLCLGGRMDLPPAAALLIDALQAVTVIPGSSPVALRIGWLLDRLEEECRAEAPGSAAMATHIMQIVFIELIRALPATAARGWLAALADPRIGPALRAIHREPGRAWRLQELAEVSHLSRSQFSARFRQTVGQAPMDYLLHWRMALARQALSRPGATIESVADELGYASPSAFGVAFRRVTGTTPRRVAREVTRQPRRTTCSDTT